MFHKPKGHGGNSGTVLTDAAAWMNSSREVFETAMPVVNDLAKRGPSTHIPPKKKDVRGCCSFTGRPYLLKL
jgi:hypothetical protein